MTYIPCFIDLQNKKTARKWTQKYRKSTLRIVTAPAFKNSKRGRTHKLCEENRCWKKGTPQKKARSCKATIIAKIDRVSKNQIVEIKIIALAKDQKAKIATVKDKDALIVA